MIEIKHLSMKFGSFTAVDDVSFQVQKGEVLGFLGPNGAGKSTTMKMITGFLTPVSGTAIVCDFDIAENPIEAKKNIGYLPEGAPVYADMTVQGFLEFIADVRGYSKEEKQVAVETAMEKTHLQEVKNKSIDTLSKGFKRRVGIAQAILHDPPVLIMDEPTDGLDPNQKFEVRELIKKMAKDKAIIISTHILEEVEAICTRAIIIAQGKKLFDGSPAELQGKAEDHNAVQVSFSPSNRPANFESTIKAIEGISEIKQREENGTIHYTLLSKEGRSIAQRINQVIQEQNWKVDELFSSKGQLDTVFRQLTQSGEQKGVRT